ncbi:hypothetical protein [Oryzifoliimicrobium ureilyticus]|uniref:hypothetical protein n=1 Tax=Oryzifoliimicrobium ureilyticus TaxID=3113724 RepID=UPI0030760732
MADNPSIKKEGGEPEVTWNFGTFSGFIATRKENPARSGAECHPAERDSAAFQQAWRELR